MVTIRGPPLNARAPQEDINYDVCTVGRIPLEDVSGRRVTPIRGPVAGRWHPL